MAAVSDYLGAVVLAVFLAAAMVLVGRFISTWLGSVRRRVRSFLGHGAAHAQVVTRSFPSVELPNLQLALDRVTETGGFSVTTIGYAGVTDRGASLRELLSRHAFAATVGPPHFRDVDVGVGTSRRCLDSGMLLLDDGRTRLVINVRPERGSVEVEILSAEPAAAATVMEQLRANLRAHSVYRRQALSLERRPDAWGQSGHAYVRFHRVEPISADEIVLPDATFALLRRTTLDFYAHADGLKAAQRSLKRGVLLHGKPGTGKTLVARWLAGALTGFTVIFVSGDQLSLIGECCRMARLLVPAMVVLEDVDLIASQRDPARSHGPQATLHQLLNEMDGIDSEADVLFLLTTNRPEVIEPALVGRPGRIDQAIEFPLPDADCRRRLFELYGRGLDLGGVDLERWIARTDGSSPAFIKELLRKATALALESEAAPALSDSVLDRALGDLVLGGGELTRRLLGWSAADT